MRINSIFRGVVKKKGEENHAFFFLGLIVAALLVPIMAGPTAPVLSAVCFVPMHRPKMYVRRVFVGGPRLSGNDGCPSNEERPVFCHTHTRMIP